jgi:hypothetical protein
MYVNIVPNVGKRSKKIKVYNGIVPLLNRTLDRQMDCLCDDQLIFGKCNGKIKCFQIRPGQTSPVEVDEVQTGSCTKIRFQVTYTCRIVQESWLRFDVHV